MQLLLQDNIRHDVMCRALVNVQRQNVAIHAGRLKHSPSFKVFMLIGPSIADPPIARCVSLLNSLRVRPFEPCCRVVRERRQRDTCLGYIEVTLETAPCCPEAEPSSLQSMMVCDTQSQHLP